MINGKKVLALIPARGGSKGLPGKNIKMLCGRPLLGWPIQAAKLSKYVDKIIVSTDDEKIKQVALDQGAEVPFLRPAFLAGDEAKSADVIEHAINFLQKEVAFDYIILLEPTSPLTEAKDIDQACEILDSKRGIADAIVGVSKVENTHPVFDVVINNEGLIAPYVHFNFESVGRRQDLNDLYFFEGSLYISDVQVFLQQKTFYHNRTLPYIVPKWKAFEIDNMVDFICIEAIMKNIKLLKKREIVMNFSKSNQLRVKAQNLIPAGAHTYSKGDDQFPELSPGFIVRGKGSKVWDPDGNKFLDWGMGLRSVILGHADDRVLDAVKTQLELGANFTRPSTIEVEVAEMLVELIPSAEMVKFAKNGSDATTAAVKISRAYTGRDIIVRCQDHPFFSVNDWFIGDTACNAGVPLATQQLTKKFRYNDTESLEAVLNANKGNVACVILEPAATADPKPGFLEKVKELTHKHGAVLIFDEMISGFRWHQQGAQTYYGVTPDLATFGKAIGNGFSVSAVVGKKEIMELGGLEHNKPRVFLLSTTHGGETHSLAAVKATINILKDGEIVKQNWRKGQKLIDGFNGIVKEFGLLDYVKMTGVACSPYQVFLDKNGKVDLSLRTLYLQEMIKEGVLIPWIAIADAHSEQDIEMTLEASRKAIQVLKQAVEKGSTDGLLVGKAVKPVFRKYN